MEFVALGIVLGVFAVIAVVAFLKAPTRRELPPAEDPRPAAVETAPATPESAPVAAQTSVAEAPAADTSVVETPTAPDIEAPPPSAGRLVRLRARLAASQSGVGRTLLVASVSLTPVAEPVLTTGAAGPVTVTVPFITLGWTGQ